MLRKCFVVLSKCLVVLSKCLVVLSKCFIVFSKCWIVFSKCFVVFPVGPTACREGRLSRFLRVHVCVHIYAILFQRFCRKLYTVLLKCLRYRELQVYGWRAQLYTNYASTPHGLQRNGTETGASAGCIEAANISVRRSCTEIFLPSAGLAGGICTSVERVPWCTVGV